MVASLLRWLTPAALCLAAVATAQPAPTVPHKTPAKADPLDPAASVPALAYESAFTRDRRALDDKPIPWREANDNVARIGGWRAYAREAQQPDPALTAPASAAAPSEARPMPMPMPQGHRGHKQP